MEPTASLWVSAAASSMITSAPCTGSCGFSWRRSPHTLLFVFSLSSHFTVLPSLSYRHPRPLSQPDSGPGPLLVAGYEDGSLMLWDVTQRTRLSQVKAHPEPVMCLTFDPSRLRGVSGSSEKSLSSWTLDRQNNLQVSRCNDQSGPQSSLT